MEIVRVSEGPGHRFGGVGNVLVCVYAATPQVSALQDRVPWIEATIARAGSIGLMVVVAADAAGSLPGAAFRAESKRQADLYRDALVLSASAIEGDGVMHSLIRTFLRGLALAAAKDIDVGFFDHVEAAATWTAEGMRDHGGPTAEQLVEAVERLRPATLEPDAR